MAAPAPLSPLAPKIYPSLPPIAGVRFATIEAGVRYDAAVRERLEVNELPKPFQLNALASREWQLDSGWHRFAFTP